MVVKSWANLLKRFLTVAFLLTVVLGSLGGISKAEEEEEFRIVESTPWGTTGVVLIAYRGPGGDVVVPDGVTVIGDSAFGGHEEITSITLPDSVTKIESNAFGDCSGLQSISLSNNLKEIGYTAFCGCNSLTHIDLPESLEMLGNEAFAACVSLSDIIIPEKIKTIPYGCFSGCVSLTDVTLSENVEIISDYAFSSCNKLITIDLPSRLKEIGNYAFSNCSNFTSVSFPKRLATIGTMAFSGCSLTEVTVPAGVYNLRDRAFPCNSIQSITVLGDIGKDEEYDLLYDILWYWPDTCSENLKICGRQGTNIEKYAKEKDIPFEIIEADEWVIDEDGLLLQYNGTDRDVIIPDTVTEIGTGVFAYRHDYTSIRIPDSVEEIGIGSFYRCSALSDITIPSGVVSIDANAFENCSGLSIISIPDSVISIGEGAFDGCSSLETVLIPDSVTEMGSNVFYDCSRLQSVKIPQNVQSDDILFMFYGCESLKEVVFFNDFTLSDHYGLGFLFDESKLDDIVIYGHRGSRIEQKALEEGVTFFAIEDVPEIVFAGANVDLSDVINLNLYFDVDRDMIPYGRMGVKVTYPDGQVKIHQFDENKKLVEKDKTFYGITCLVAAKEVNDTISIQAWDTVTDQACGNEIAYSVKKYCDELMKTTTEDSALGKLVKEIYTYSSYAQLYFNHNVDSLAADLAEGSLSSLSEVRDALESQVCFTLTGELPEGIDYVGCSLVLNSSIEYRIYFSATTPELAEQYGLLASDRAGLYYCENVTTSITQLMENREYHIGDATICTNPMNYIRLVSQREYDGKLTDLIIAVYDYYQAAMDYYNYSLNYGPMGNETELV